MGDSNLKYVLYDGVSCDDVRTSSLKSGKVSFDAVNGIVTLDNVVYENTHGGSDGEFLRISYNGTTMMDFTIIVKGTNTITTYGTKALNMTYLKTKMILEQGGSDTADSAILDITCTNPTGAGVYLNNSTMNVAYCTLQIHGGELGIGGNVSYPDVQKLAVNHATIRANGTKGSIRYVSSQFSSDSKIFLPEGATFSESKHAVVLNDEIVTDEVVICDRENTAPMAGTKPTFSNITTTGMTVNWGAATDNFTPKQNLRYMLQYKKSTDTTWTTAMDYTMGQTSHTISGLSENTQYDFLVTVKDECRNTKKYTQASQSTSVTYDFYVGGVRVTSTNASDIPSPYFTKGKASYSAASNTLTLDSIVMTGNRPLVKVMDAALDLNIKMKGNNIVNATDTCVLYLLGDTHLTGDTLTVTNNESGNFACIQMGDASLLSIDSTTVYVHGKYGVRGNGNSTIAVNKSTLTAYGATACIQGFSAMTIYKSYFSEPDNVAFNASKKGVCVGSTLVKGKDVVILPNRLFINNVGINPNTYVTGLSSGTAYFDGETNTLTLNNANICCDDGVDAIVCEKSDLTIKLVGTNTITSNSTNVIHVPVDVSNTQSLINEEKSFIKTKLFIEGPGTLNLVNIKEENSAAFSLGLSDLTLKDCTVNINSINGIGGEMTAFAQLIGIILQRTVEYGNGHMETLTVNNATLNMTNEQCSPIFLDGLYLKNCKISNPVGAAYANTGYITLDGEKYEGPFCVSPVIIPTAIDAISEQPQEEIWYTLGGQRISRPAKAGLYI
ncbi:MAG: fibronectin type III domain-containing protein, partial [Prevotella sp.]|nr:fibronectin type III domain-containing protein [Prevotella sp.]